MTTVALRLSTALAAAAASALALLPASAVGAGVLPACAGQTLTQPFLPWLDPAHYVEAPDGGLEFGGTDWVLTGGAAVVAGNEPYLVRAPTDAHALHLPRGSAAWTPPGCVSVLHPTMRFFARGGSVESPLLVDVVFRDVFGFTRRLPIGTVPVAPAWAPTPPFPFFVNVTALPIVGDAVFVSFGFRPAGDAGWWIDDVHVDPYKGR